VITAVWLLAPNVPVIITHPVTVLTVAKLKTALAEPFPMVTLAGTPSAGLLLVSATVDVPTLGADSVAVQLPDSPGTIVEGVQVRLDNSATSDSEIEKVCEVPFNLAVRTAIEAAAKVPDFATNEPEDKPPDTVIVPLGRVSAALLLDSVIDAVLPCGTGFVRVMVQVVDVCGSIAPAAQASEDTPSGAVREIVAVADVPFKVPVKVAVWFALTVPVETLKVPDAAPAGTVTLAGAINTGEALFVNIATVPPASAPSERFKVQVALALEASVAAEQLSPVMVGGGSSVRVAVAAGPFKAPVRVAIWFFVTVPTETVNVAVVAPAVTVTDAGTVRVPVALLVRVTREPPGSAGFDSVTEHVVVPFEERVVNVHASPLTVGGFSSDIATVAVDPLSDAVRVAV